MALLVTLFLVLVSAPSGTSVAKLVNVASQIAHVIHLCDEKNLNILCRKKVRNGSSVMLKKVPVSVKLLFGKFKNRGSALCSEYRGDP